MAEDAGLAAIEWGGDVHVPLGDLAAARKARALCEDERAGDRGVRLLPAGRQRRP